MMPNKIWKAHVGESCPSCIALNGQIHETERWLRADLEPKSFRLYCAEKCNCTLSETDQYPSGDLSTVPLRLQGEYQMPNPRNEEIRFDAFQSKPIQTAKGYDVLVIHAGQANGWNFGETVLQNCVRFWQGVECFADHNEFGESVHDLAGVFSNPRWDPDQRGIVATVRPTGPAQHLLRMYADEMLNAEHDPHPNMGFSPVIIFTSKGDDVQEILRVRSVDMVINPAFRTKFISEKFSQRREEMPTDPEVLKEKVNNPEAAEHILAMREITGAQAEITAAVQGAKETHLATCQNLLQTSLDVAAVDLPVEAVKLIEGRFNGRVFKPTELQAEIKSFKEAFAQQKASAIVAGPTQVTAMFNSEDQLQAAMDDLLDAPRNEGAEKLKVHRFGGIKEAYLMLTGDREFVGDVDPILARFQGTTATFPNLVANALNKAILKYWNMYGDAGYNWWEKIATVEPFETLHDIKWLRLGTISSLPVVAEGAEYTELKLGDNGEASVFYKYGGYLSFTLEALDKDDTRKLRAAPREIALAARRNISEQIAAIFTVNAGAGPTLADTGALFNSTAVTTAGGHANLLTTALGTTYTAWDAIALAMYNQPMLVANEAGYYGTGKKQAIDPAIVLVPRALTAAAQALFVPRWEAQAQNVAAVSPMWGGRVEVVTVPEWTDATDYAAIIDPRLVPGIMIGTRYGLIPQIILAGEQTNPAMFSNDESRLKVRHFLATGVGNWSALHKSNVT
jgi:hypothetical protein